MTVADFLQGASNLGTAAAAIFTALAAWAAVRQLRMLKQQGVTTLEDALGSEYRQLASTLPLPALLGEPLTDDQHGAALDEFYRYFDLCNHQVFLRDNGRISEATWSFWKEGIESNLKRPAFARAWAEIAGRATGDFDELRGLCPPGQPAASRGAA